ncbi:LysR family transcriptional regulator [Enterobacter hormaechei]|nr:LysR family transcriptional regulator [Enterobacter hormaechei]MCE1468070.1 LysR family transcriptional regulator [Enterobacter hormaechei]
MDQLMAMRAFTRVVESGSFTRAADSLNMPIATLSKLVKSLEAHLETGALVEILSDWRPKAYPFHVVYPQSRHLTHRLRVFIAWLAEVFPAAVKG